MKMKLQTVMKSLGALLAVGLMALPMLVSADTAPAADAAAAAAAAPVPNKGDTAWMLVSTLLRLVE
jgi:Amt family ammonium transporter